MSVEVKFHRTSPSGALYVTLDGRQALQEGPRKNGHCNACKCQCRGNTAGCSARVFHESAYGARR